MNASTCHSPDRYRDAKIFTSRYGSERTLTRSTK